MLAPAIPDDEAERLQQLHELLVLDSEPEPVFDTLARMASEVCGAPIALLTLVDEQRQWFKSSVGLPGLTETPREQAFCAHAIHGSALFEVPDATLDERFADNPLVTGQPDIRFYAGAPLRLTSGHRMGTLCVIDHHPRQLNAAQQAQLQQLAQLASQMLEMRGRLMRKLLAVRSRHEDALRASRALLERTGRVAGVGGWQLDLRSGQLDWSTQTRRIHEVGPDFVPTLDKAIAFYAPEARPLIAQAMAHGRASGSGWDLELPLVSAAGRPLWVRTMGEVESEDGQAVRLIGAFQDVTERRAAEHALRDLTDIVHNSSDYVVQTDHLGQVTYMNPAARQAAGVAADAPLAGLDFTRFHPPAVNQLFGDVILPHAQAHGVWLGQVTIRLPGPRDVPVSDLVIAHRDAEGTVQRYSAVMRDISADIKAQHALQRQTATLRSVTEAIAAIVLVAGADQCCRFVNGAFERWAGAPRERIVGRSLQEVLGRGDHDRVRERLQRVLAGETVNFELDYPARSTARHLAWSYVPLWLDSGEVDGFIGVAQDITAHRQEQTRLLDLAQRDPLTGLLNRAGFEQHLQRCLQDGGGPGLGLLYIDLDHFKPVNDQHGHPVGDRLLQALAQRLLKLVRPTDAVARLGGDEFAIALSGVQTLANVQAVADKVIAAAQLPFDVAALRLTVGASVGVAFGVDAADGAEGAKDAEGWAGLIARADAMLYQAKAAGRGRRAG